MMTSQLDLNLLYFYMLLLADGITLFTTDRDSLQLQLNNLAEYSQKWGLKINATKTKCLINN